ncbi:hypothetical protein OS493_031494 [Desmophyllum pertusum]|uniref:SEFIR domain-containing protein n=1 Tax=Desmophyllum pertusum TaxID=174260 RepID=A0A9X0D0T0_9CNID|nr:hypothetical protein OS493_031494 [Desmophyllum pertusum]
MPNGFLAITEWFSVSVLILLGAATPSTGTYGLMHDKNLSETSSDSLCHLRCAKDASKVISVEECVQSCQRKLQMMSLDPSHDVIKERPLIRHQRSVGNMNGIRNECKGSSETTRDAVHVKRLSVNFTAKKPDIKVAWEAMDSSKTAFNWTAYALIYQVGESKLANCKVIPKNQTNYLVPGDHWKSPDPLHLAVVAYPYHEQSAITLEAFNPKGTAKLISSIVGGLIAGMALLLILYAAVKWKRSRLCPVVDNGRMPPPAPPPSSTKDRYYSCYYPESDAFRQRVASIVNYFRENGYNIIMDVMVSDEINSQGPTRWGESQIRKAKKVLIFLSPGLVNLALDDREDSQSQDVNRVWIELEVLRDLYTRNRSASKMVCITLPDMPVTSEGLPLWAKVSYKWPDDALEILKRLNDRPMILPV